MNKINVESRTHIFAPLNHALQSQDYAESKHHEQPPNILGFGLFIYFKLSAYIYIYIHLSEHYP